MPQLIWIGLHSAALKTWSWAQSACMKPSRCGGGGDSREIMDAHHEQPPHHLPPDHDHHEQPPLTYIIIDNHLPPDLDHHEQLPSSGPWRSWTTTPRSRSSWATTYLQTMTIMNNCRTKIIINRKLDQSSLWTTTIMVTIITIFVAIVVFVTMIQMR